MVELPDDQLVDLLVAEVRQVDGVAVEEVRPVAEAMHDPRLDALEAAAQLVGADSVDELLAAVVHHARRVVGRLGGGLSLDDDPGRAPPRRAGPQTRAGGRPRGAVARLAGGVPARQPGRRGAAGAARAAAADVVWAPLPRSGWRSCSAATVAYRAASGASWRPPRRVVDTRMRELDDPTQGRPVHPPGARPYAAPTRCARRTLRPGARDRSTARASRRRRRPRPRRRRRLEARSSCQRSARSSASHTPSASPAT